MSLLIIFYYFDGVSLAEDVKVKLVWSICGWNSVGFKELNDCLLLKTLFWI